MIEPTALLRELVATNIPVYPSVTAPRPPITLKSIADFFGALGWLWLLLLSFTGWGRFVARVFRLSQLPASIACLLGASIGVFIGGLLNIFGGIYRGALLAMVIGGLALYIALRREKPEGYRWKGLWAQTSSVSRMLLIAALLILIFRVAGTARLAHFDVSDDSAAYLSLPQKMLDTHHFASDPFSERRITSSLGGSYFLQDMVLSATSLPHIGMADRAFGFILLAGVLIDLGIAFEVPLFQIALLELLALLIPQETFNLTFIVLPVSLLLGIVWLAVQILSGDFRNSVRYSVLAGIIAGAVISLKSTYLPIGCALLSVPFFLLVTQKPKIAIKLLLASTIGLLVVLVAWMTAMKITSGTYLFPVLGRGFDYTRYGMFHAISRFSTARSIAKIVLQGIFLIVLAAIEIVSMRKTKQSRISATVLIVSAISIVAMNYATSADSIWRYNFPQCLAAVIVFYAAAFAGASKDRPTLGGCPVSYFAIAAMLLMMFYYDIAGTTPELFHEMNVEMGTAQPILAALSGQPLASTKIQAQYREAQETISRKGTTIENVAYPFLFNYRNAKIMIMDWPGAAAPFPGWPFGKTSDDVARYLKHNGITYVIFDYRYALQNDAKMCQDLTGSGRFSEWLREQLWLNILTDSQLDHLMSRYRSIYNDGNIIIIDLYAPLSASPDREVPWKIGSDVGQVCSPVAARFFHRTQNMTDRHLNGQLKD